MAGGGATKSSGSSSSSGDPIAAGGGPMAGVLFDAFNLPTKLVDGQITQAADTGYIPRTRDEAIKYAEKHLKEWGWGHRARGYANNSDKLKEYEKHNVEKIRKAKWESEQTTGKIAEGPGGALTRNLLSGIEDEQPFGQDMLDIGRQAVDAQRNIFDLSTKSLAGLIEDGRPVDVQALVDRGVTDLKEQFGGQGLSYSSDVRNAAVRSGAEMRSVSEENARNRQMGAIQMGQSHAQAGLQFGSMVGNLGAQYELQATPWGRAITRFGQLANPQPTALSSIGSKTRSESEYKSSGWNASS